jgi:hypothetical protein
MSGTDVGVVLYGFFLYHVIVLVMMIIDDDIKRISFYLFVSYYEDVFSGTNKKIIVICFYCGICFSCNDC